MTRPRHRKQARSNTSHLTKSKNGALLLTLFLLGLLFCIVDLVYLFYFTSSQSLSKDNYNPVKITTTSAKSEKRDVVIDHNDKDPSSPVHHHQAQLQLQQMMEMYPGKERILEILRDAHYTTSDLTPDIMARLPTWQQVVDRLGPEPKIYGLDSCQTFQDAVDPPERFIAPAGKFNSGTNLMAELLLANCYNPERRKKHGTAGVRWQVNWGKHTPPKFRLQHEVYEDKSAPPNDFILPVVTIRDPYFWMQSMCRNRYATHWFHEVNFHCPNLIPNHVEREFLPQALDGSYKRDRRDLHHKDPWLMDNVMNTANYTLDSKTVPVYVKYKLETTNHESLAHLWNDWYHAYYNADFPRVIVRYEDLLFYGQEVTKAACECFGGVMKKKFSHVGDSAKKGDIHLNKTSLVDNLIKFGSRKDSDKIKGMTKEDLVFARDSLASDMMETFAYHHPNINGVDVQ